MTGKATIIVCIDDDDHILQLNKTLLEGTGNYKVHCFSSAVDALRNTGALRPNLILLDMVMPEMDGIKVFEKLKAAPETRAVPVIFMTAQKNPADVKKYMDLGALAVITKPVDPEDFPYQVQMLSKVAGES